MDMQTDRDATTLYARLEDRVMARDQVGASQVYYDLVRAGRPLNEIIAEGVRIHAPYTHQEILVRKALELPTIDVLGTSYGTRLALELMRQQPGSVRGAALFEPMTSWPRGIGGN